MKEETIVCWLLQSTHTKCFRVWKKENKQKALGEGAECIYCGVNLQALVTINRNKKLIIKESLVV